MTREEAQIKKDFLDELVYPTADFEKLSKTKQIKLVRLIKMAETVGFKRDTMFAELHRIYYAFLVGAGLY